MKWNQNYDMSYKEALKDPDPFRFIDERWGDPSIYISEFLEEYLPAGNVVEVGSGFGRYARRIMNQCNCVYAVEASKLCRKFLEKNLYPHVIPLEMDAITGLTAQSIDLAFSFSTMLHFNLYEIWWYMKQLIPKLKVGGHFVIHYASMEEPGAVDVFLSQPCDKFGDVGRYLFHHPSQIESLGKSMNCVVVSDKAPSNPIVACHRVITLKRNS